MHVDLHCHSTASDGTLTPAELVAAMASAGVELMALTDHDTVAGLDDGRAAATRHGLHWINGIELSARWGQQTIHVVGLGIDPSSATLQARIRATQTIREQRAERIAHKLAGIGVHDPLARATQAANGGQITRTHFARLLVDDGLCKDMKRAFKQYLGAGKPAYVSAPWPAMAEVIADIHAAGGQAVLAHPMRYGMSATKRRLLLDAFVTAGGDALEISCGPNTVSADQVSAADAKRLGLMGSVGSDFHDPAQGWIRLDRVRHMPSGITPVWERLSAAR